MWNVNAECNPQAFEAKLPNKLQVQDAECEGEEVVYRSSLYLLVTMTYIEENLPLNCEVRCLFCDGTVHGSMIVKGLMIAKTR